MREETRDALIEINRRFYAVHAQGFDASRRRAWQGWEELWQLFGDAPVDRPLRVLDAGCGNGRFAHFLQERAGKIDYLGLDIAPALLESARGSLGEEVHRIRLREHDLLREPLPLDASYDWIGLYGVLHHLPGFTQRCKFVCDLARGLAPGGMLSMSFWCFDRLPNWRRKTLPWEEYLQTAESPVDLKDLEPGDHLLTWSGETRSPRYCHAPDDAEVERFAAAIVELPGIICTERFFADGPSGVSNLYLIFRATS